MGSLFTVSFHYYSAPQRFHNTLMEHILYFKTLKYSKRVKSIILKIKSSQVKSSLIVYLFVAWEGYCDSVHEGLRLGHTDSHHSGIGASWVWIPIHLCIICGCWALPMLYLVTNSVYAFNGENLSCRCFSVIIDSVVLLTSVIRQVVAGQKRVQVGPSHHSPCEGITWTWF